jgi:hypothetical protein
MGALDLLLVVIKENRKKKQNLDKLYYGIVRFGHAICRCIQ